MATEAPEGLRLQSVGKAPGPPLAAHRGRGCGRAGLLPEDPGVLPRLSS